MRALTTLLLLFLISSPIWGQVPPETMKKYQQDAKQRLVDQMFVSNLVMLGNRSDLRDELEVVDDQTAALRKIGTSYFRQFQKFQLEESETGKEIQQYFKNGQTEKAIELSQDFNSKQRKIYEQMMTEVNEILLPHQVDRLLQISKQRMLTVSNPFGDEFGAAVGLATELELTPEETRELVSKIGKVREEFYEEVKKLKEKARKDILDCLAPEKREKFKKAFGEYYDMEAQGRAARNKARKAMERKREEMRARFQGDN